MEQVVVRSDLAKMLWQTGVANIKPNSSVYFNFCKKPRGPLSSELLLEFGKALATFAKLRGVTYAGIVDVPHAARPLGQAFAFAAGCPRFEVEKIQEEDRRRFTIPATGLISQKGRLIAGDRVAVIDEAVKSGDSAIAVAKLLRSGNYVVEDIVVFVDCERGALKKLTRHNLRLHAMFCTSALLAQWRQECFIREEDYQRCLVYIHQD